MFPTTLKTFVHPKKVYKLDYPGHWDQVTKEDGESCGFGPHDRDDVGLWVSVMPMSLDTDKIQDDLPKLMNQVLDRSGGVNLRRDTALKQFGLIADMTADGQGGHYWLVAGGDVVLFASTQVPVAERDEWNPQLQKVMASLQITRDEHLFVGQVANELLAKLREQCPEQEFAFDNDKIRGKNQVVYLTNLLREVKASPKRRTEIIAQFAQKIGQPAMEELGCEEWDEARGSIIPVLKPKDYVQQEGPTQHLYTVEWLSDVLICYVIRSKNMYRFVTGWDLDRWGLEPEAFQKEALANLAKLPWPKQLVGSRGRDSGRIIVVDTDDNLASSRLLHPELHRMFSGPLGSTFCAGIPCRDTLVLFSNRRELKKSIGRKLKQDHRASAYPITDRPFLVTRDGIAPADK